MRIFKLAKEVSYGYCLDKALAYLESHPTGKLMMGKPGRQGDTAHFWVEDAPVIIDPLQNPVLG